MLLSIPIWFAFAAIAVTLVIGSTIAWVLWHPADIGHGRLFTDQTFHFQTLRALNDVVSDGADISEVLETIRHIRAGGAQGWFRAWSQTGDQVSRLASATADRIAKGRALLRAHNYYRTAEFFLPARDRKRSVSAQRIFSHSTYARKSEGRCMPRLLTADVRA